MRPAAHARRHQNCDVLRPDQAAHSRHSDRFGAQRLDHILAAPGAGTLVGCDYDHAPRTSGITDHAAHLATFTWPSA